MASYKINIEGNLLRIGFDEPAQNDEIVVDATQQLTKLVDDGVLAGGEILRINGPASLPVAMAIAHAVGHLYQAVACFDPKLSKYVVSIAHGDKYSVGELVG